jgi:glycosyltransferase involved in cell wall biosynthesis
MSRARILLVKPVLPYPPDQGTKVVSMGLIEALGVSHDVTVLARLLGREEEKNVRELEKRCARVVTVLPANRTSFAARVGYKLVYAARSATPGGRSLTSQYDCPGATIRAARALARDGFDLYIVEYWQMFPLLDVFPRERTVLLTHDIDALVHRGRASIERDIVTRVRAATTWRREANEEKRAYQRAGRVWTLTRRDADGVRTIAGRDADVLPLGLAPDSFVEDPAPRTSHEVLIVGAMHSAFNRDAIDHFVRDIYPELASLADLRFTVVGGPLPLEVEEFARQPGVEVPGHAPNLRPYLERATCLVVPLRFAGGIRIRILHAMAAGLPVVCSPVAVDGMGFEPGRHVLVATTPHEYRRHVERLLVDKAFAQGLARAAREHVWRAHGPDARGPGLRALVDRALAERPF